MKRLIATVVLVGMLYGPVAGEDAYVAVPVPDGGVIKAP